MAYTVKQLSNLAGVSIRTLHYYDQVGLLKPESYGENGYRYYGNQAVYQLQQILFFKELDFSLEEIQQIVNKPDFDLLTTLQIHKEALQNRVSRLENLIQTVNHTILNLKGKQTMKAKEIFSGFSEEKQKKYEAEIRQRYGDKAFEGVTDWNSYTPEKKAVIKAESEAIYQDIQTSMSRGSDSPDVQQAIARWHQHLRYFYEPSVERLSGLADMYVEHPDFQSMFTENYGPGFAEFLRKAIKYYCSHL
jgi:MerR family transcriptional regulator, thiopeptide resistance regulator